MKKTATCSFFVAALTIITTSPLVGMIQEKKDTVICNRIFEGLKEQIKLTTNSVLRLGKIIGEKERISLIHLHEKRILSYLACTENLKSNIIKNILIATYKEKNKKISKIFNLKNGEEFLSVEAHIGKKKYNDQTIIKYRHNNNFLCALISTRLYHTNRLKKIILIDLETNEIVKTFRNTSNFILLKNHLFLNSYNSTFKLVSLDNMETIEFNKVDSYKFLGKEKYLEINYRSGKRSELVDIKKNKKLGKFSIKKHPLSFKALHNDKQYIFTGNFQIFLDYNSNKFQEKIKVLENRKTKKFIGVKQ